MAVSGRRIRLVAATIVGAAVSVAPNAVQAVDIPDGAPASLVGRIVNDTTQRAIGGATVEIVPCIAPSPEADTPDIRPTNNGGHYLFKGLAEGDYCLTASSSGYNSAVRLPVRVNKTGMARLDISLSPSPSTIDR